VSAPQDDAAIVATMVREFDFPRYAATLFAPVEKRRAMLALAAFDLEIIRIPDHVSQPLPGEVRLQWWTDALEGNEHGGVAGHPVAAELMRAIEDHALPHVPLLSLIEAHKFDLYDDGMPNSAALDVYCDDTVGSLVGLNALLLAGGPYSLGDGMREAGRALGLTRLLTRLPHDAAHRRCFLPDDAMAAHGVARHQMLAGEDSPALQAVRNDLIATARRYLETAVAGLKARPATCRPAFLPLANLMRELDALDGLSAFAVAPSSSRLRVLASQWWMMR
jgi:phytoene synthase